MKKTTLIIATLALVIAATSCHQGKHVTIVNDNNGIKISLEYYGKIAFTEDNMGIKSMAPDSHIEFKSDDKKLTAERDHGSGKIFYQQEDGTKTDTLSQENKHLIAEVLKRVGKLEKKEQE